MFKKTWVRIFQVKIFWVGIFRVGIFEGEFDGWEFSGGSFPDTLESMFESMPSLKTLQNTYVTETSR